MHFAVCVKLAEKKIADLTSLWMACFSREEGHTSLLLEVRNHTAPDGQIIQVDKVVKYFWKKVTMPFAACFRFLFIFFIFSCDYFLQFEVQPYMASQYAVRRCSHFRVTHNLLACDVLSDHSGKHASGCNYVLFCCICSSWWHHGQSHNPHLWNPGHRVQELCESWGGHPGLPVLMSLTVSVEVKQHWTMLTHWSQFVPDMLANIQGHEALLYHHHHSDHSDWGELVSLCRWTTFPTSWCSSQCRQPRNSVPWRVFTVCITDSVSLPTHQSLLSVDRIPSV